MLGSLGVGDRGAVVLEAVIVKFCCLRACSFWRTGPPKIKIWPMQWHLITMSPCHCIELFYKGINSMSAIEHARGVIGSIILPKNRQHQRPSPFRPLP